MDSCVQNDLNDSNDEFTGTSVFRTQWGKQRKSHGYAGVPVVPVVLVAVNACAPVLTFILSAPEPYTVAQHRLKTEFDVSTLSTTALGGP